MHCLTPEHVHHDAGRGSAASATGVLAGHRHGGFKHEQRGRGGSRVLQCGLHQRAACAVRQGLGMIIKNILLNIIIIIYNIIIKVKIDNHRSGIILSNIFTYDQGCISSLDLKILKTHLGVLA